MENFDFRIFFLNLLDRNFERFRIWIFLYLIKYPKNFRDNNYSIKNFFTHCWWKIRKISNLDKIFCRRFPWWHAWFNDQNPSLLALYVQGVQDEKLDRLRRNFIARKEETKRGQVIAFSTNESNKKGRKIAPFRASARFKIQFSFSVSSRQSRDDAGLVSLRTDPNMSGVHCCRLLWRLRAPSGYGILVKACRKDKIVWVEAHHRARRRWNSSSHGVSKRFSMEPWLLPPRILSRDWNSWRWWNFSCSF